MQTSRPHPHGAPVADPPQATSVAGAGPVAAGAAGSRPPVILLGPGRSFTTVVAAMLGQHPAHFGVPELNTGVADTVGEFLRITSNATRPVGQGLIRAVAQLALGEQSVASIEETRAWLVANAAMPMTELVLHLREAVAPRALVEKSPLMTANPEYLQRMLHQFPDARFIHLTRHPRSACQSMLRWPAYEMLLRMGVAESFDRRCTPPVFDPQVHWFLANGLVMEMLDSLPPDRWRRIQGETVLEDPAGSLAPICDWLGVDSGPEALAAMQRPEDSPFAVAGPPNAQYGGDPSFFEAPHLRPFRRPEATLSGPLPWRPDGAGFSADVVEMAHVFGYHDTPESASPQD